MLESLFSNVLGLKACNIIKKRLQQRCFPVNIAKHLRIPILKNICGRLLLEKLKENSVLYDISASGYRKDVNVENA